MKMIFFFDDVLRNPDEYVDDILDNGFIDFNDGHQVFKRVMPRGLDEFTSFLLENYPDYEVALSFARQSPEGQEEPNYIHTDEMMGDLTAVLYLNKEHPIQYGTTIYDDDDNILYINHARYNSCFVFSSNLPHSRNLENNFGDGDDSRLVQVVFLKKKKI